MNGKTVLYIAIGLFLILFFGLGEELGALIRSFFSGIGELRSE